MMAMRLLLAASIIASTASAAIGEVGQTRMSPNAEFLAKHYPPQALKRGEQGKVGFRLVVEPDGSLGSCEVVESSGFKSLDEATCDTIISYARLKQVRDSEGRSVRATQVGYIDWKLPAAAGQPASAGKSASVKDPERIICRREQKTGSLVGKTKVCMTAREWAQMSRQYREQAERIVGTCYSTEEGIRACENSMQNPGGC